MEDESAESYMEEDLESVALFDDVLNNPSQSATNDNLKLASLLAGLESKSKFITNLNLNKVDLVQALINLSGNYKYARIELVSYYFEVRKNEDKSEENCFSDSGDEDEAESKMENNLESVALPDSDVNKPTQSATSDNLELVTLLAGLESKSKLIANLNLNNLDLVQTFINLLE